jgi:hypothetical protein
MTRRAQRERSSARPESFDVAQDMLAEGRLGLSQPVASPVSGTLPLRELTAWFPRWCGMCGRRVWFTKTWTGWVHTIGWVALIFLCAHCVKRLHQPCRLCVAWGANACIAGEPAGET